MNVWPLKFREIDDHRMFFADDAGGFFLSDHGFLHRYGKDLLTKRDLDFLHSSGHAYQREGDLAHTAFAYRWTARQAQPESLSYVMLVPTLRCNLSCTYCQVSRVAETARGFDWTSETLQAVLTFLDGLSTDHIKIEFQGGEPMLRLDMLVAVRDFCRRRFRASSFVVCTNLQSVGPAELEFLSAEDTHVSTSVDGAIADHDRHRTQDSHRAVEFFRNLHAVRQVAGDRVSALPTIDLDAPPDIDALINTYVEIGQSTIYLRPVNHQGFARRRHPASRDAERWNAYHEAFVHKLIDRNAQGYGILGEYYLNLCLRRMLAASHDNHVDLRNPAVFGEDYLVVDFNGKLYPTDEARMVTRVGVTDLSIGSVRSGIDAEKLALLNGAAFNHLDPDCLHCPYQPYCGVDSIDDISRYGRTDLPKHETWFCNRHLGLFDLAARLLYSRDDKVRFSVAHWLGLPDIPPTLSPVHHDFAPPSS